MALTARWEVSGPMSAPLGGGPTESVATAGTSLATKSSTTLWCTRNQLAAVQAWPALRNLAAIAPRTAASTSALAVTMNNALPPSSMDELTTRSAARRSSAEPTLDRTREGELANPRVLQPALDDSCSVGRGDDVEHSLGDAGLRQQPGDDVGGEGGLRGRLEDGGAPGGQGRATLRATMAAGKFHGVTSAATPDRVLSHDRSGATLG